MTHHTLCMMGYGQIIYILSLALAFIDKSINLQRFFFVCKLTLERRHSQLVYDTTLLCFLSSFAQTKKNNERNESCHKRGRRRRRESK